MSLRFYNFQTTVVHCFDVLLAFFIGDFTPGVKYASSELYHTTILMNRRFFGRFHKEWKVQVNLWAQNFENHSRIIWAVCFSNFPICPRIQIFHNMKYATPNFILFPPPCLIVCDHVWFEVVYGIFPCIRFATSEQIRRFQSSSRFDVSHWAKASCVQQLVCKPELFNALLIVVELTLFWTNTEGFLPGK